MEKSKIISFFRSNFKNYFLLAYILKSLRVLIRFLQLFIFYILNFASFIKWKLDNISLKVLVIEIPHGGLGDHLFYTKLPQIAKNSFGYDKVFISKLSKIRRKDHYNILWTANPFVDGFCYSHGRVINNVLPESDSPLKNINKSGKNILDLVKIEYNLDDKARFDEPIIYYEPKFIEYYKDKVIFDPNFITNQRNLDNYDFIKHFFTENNIDINCQFPAKKGYEVLNISSNFIYDKDFYEYLDILNSCKDFYCFASGSAVLMRSINRKANVFYSDTVDLGFLFTNKNSYIKY